MVRRNKGKTYIDLINHIYRTYITNIFNGDNIKALPTKIRKEVSYHLSLSLPLRLYWKL
jgi:hypothetical protein